MPCNLCSSLFSLIWHNLGMGKCTTWLYPFTRQAFAQCAYSIHLPFAFCSPSCAVLLPGQFLARLKEPRRQIEILNNGFCLSPSPGTTVNWNSRVWRDIHQVAPQHLIFRANVIKRRNNITSPLRIHLAIRGLVPLQASMMIFYSLLRSPHWKIQDVFLFTIQSFWKERKNNGHQFDWPYKCKVSFYIKIPAPESTG